MKTSAPRLALVPALFSSLAVLGVLFVGGEHMAEAADAHADAHAVAPFSGATITVDTPQGTETDYQFPVVTASREAAVELSAANPSYGPGGFLFEFWTSGAITSSTPVSIDPPAGGGCSSPIPGNGVPGDADVSLLVNQQAYDSQGNPTSLAVQFDIVCVQSGIEYSGTIAYQIVPTTVGQGYYLFGDDGSLAGLGNDSYLSYLGDLSQIALNAPVVGMAATPDGGGYWMVAADGGIFAYGDAGFYGSTGAMRLNQPIVGMAATPDGGGYWLVASDGGIFAYGDASFYGSMGGKYLARPIVGMAATPDGHGYWLVASDGGVFSFGDAGFHGSTGNIKLNKPVVGMAVTPDGGGYWMVASDGGIFAFGDAGFHGSMGAVRLAEPVVGMAATPDGGGYWLAASDGGVFALGDAGFFGSLAGQGIDNVAGVAP